MASCLGAQHASRRLDRLEADLAHYRRLLDLLAAELGHDVDTLHLRDVVAQRGFPIEWAEFVAIGEPLPGGDAA